MNGAKTFFDNYYLNNCFLRNIGQLLKIRLLQCYVVLWIHNIDAICIFAPPVVIYKRFDRVIYFYDLYSDTL